MEVEVVSTVKFVDSVQNVLASVGVYDIEENSYPHAMGRVDEFLQILWGTISRTCSEETGNLVTKS